MLNSKAISWHSLLLGTNIETGEDVALKLEHVSIGPSLLKAEVDVYRSLACGVGIPRVHDYLIECEYSVMAFDLLGPSLEDLFNYCGRRFSLKTVLMLADQLLARLEFVHSMDVIHRDVKPDNFLMGTGRRGNQVYVTDMGLATESREVQTKTIPTGALRRHLIGTAYFASINGHLGIRECPSSGLVIQTLNVLIVQDRSDDLESLGYMLLYFLQESLPWQGLIAEDKAQRDELILQKKKSINAKELCIDLPKEFEIYFNHIRSLAFNETPAYAYLRKLFRNLFVRNGFDNDNVFDWTVLEYLRLHQAG